MDKELIRQLLPEKPPAGLLRWTLANCDDELGEQYLVWRPERVPVYDLQELMDNSTKPKRYERVAHCTCLKCGYDFQTELMGNTLMFWIDECGEWWSLDPNGTQPFEDEDQAENGYMVEVYGDGEALSCPMCYETLNTIPAKNLRGGRRKQILVVSIESIKEYAAVVYWLVRREIYDDGNDYEVIPRDAYVLDERGTIHRYTHTSGGGYTTEHQAACWRLSSSKKDSLDSTYHNWGSISNKKKGGIFYADVPDLDGTTAEKTGLEAYANVEGTYSVEYLKLWKKFRNLENLVNTGWTMLVRHIVEYRQIYDELFRRMNEVLVRNGYAPVEYRKGYFPHFQGQDDGIMAKYGRLLGIDIMDDVLPTTINGMTHKFKPGKQWFAHAQERLGFETTYDAVEGFDKYIEGVSNVLFHTDNIQNLRALAKQIRYRSSDQGIREQVKAIQEDDALSDYEKEHKIDEVYENGKFALSNFVRELEEYTNLLAGKKSISDRGTEHWLSRKYYTWMKQLESQVGANMIGGNLTSAMTNFIPLTQAWGQLDTRNLLAGMRDTLMGMRKSDGFVVQSDFLTNRRGSETLTQSWLQKASSVADLPMEWIDNFTSESITRGAYYQNIKRGMSQEEALHQADLFAADVMGDRSKGAMPTVFEMKNPFAKVFTQFQLEVNNQLSEVFKDLPRAAKEKTVAQIAAMVFKYFFGAWMFNELFEKLIGRRPALDPINMVWEAVEDWQDDGLFEAGQNLTANVAESLPFMGGVLGGGRVPIAGALPDVGNVWEVLTEKPYDEKTGEGISVPKRLHTLGSELSKPAMLLAFPLAGNQLMKSWKGIKALIEGGSYSMDNAGNKQLQYAVHMDDPWTIFRNALMASVMGKNALPEAREWAADGYDSFNAEQTAVYQDLLDSGTDSRDAYQIIDDIRSAKKTDTQSRAVVQHEILNESDITDDSKAIIYYGMIANENEQALMDNLTDLGASEQEAGNVVRKLWDAGQLDSDQQKIEEANILKESGLTNDEKKEVVASILGTDMITEKGYPSEYAKFLTATDAGLSVDSYMEMRSKGVYMDDYFEFTDTGVPCEKAADISIRMKELKPDPGYSKVSYLQRCQVVLDTDLSEQGKLEALAAVSGLYDSTYEKIEMGYNLGMDLQSYVDLKRALPTYDANGNGSYTAKETQAAIDGGCAHLSNKEKAILWQLQNKSWKARKNPYDRNVGQMVYDAMHAAADDSDDDESDPYYLMRLLSIIS